MFSSSARRVASTGPSIPASSSFSNSAQRATATQALSYRSHQRRYSSSKPSSPADGSKGVTDVAAYAQKSKKKSKDGAASGKAKDESIKGRDESIQSLPYVPSTHHIHPNQLSASAFFSLYRPISLTNNFPKAVTEEAFASIFTPRKKTNAKPAEVISTLSRTVENLDMITGTIKKLQLSSSPKQQDQQPTEEKDELRSAVTAESNRKEAHNLDSAPEEAIMNFPHHILSGKYRPFNPPPAPVPQDAPESLAAGAEAASSQETHRVYTAVMTMVESTDQNGEVVYTTHTSPLVAEVESRHATQFRSRIQARQEQYRIRMWAISVKRQRKLKMKKHKYKKLMKRTRNLRRRLDRN